MKINFLYRAIFFLTIAIVLFIGACWHGNRTYISMTMAWLGCTIGGLTGVWIREKNNIKPDPKLTKELVISFCLALVFSAIWYHVWDTYNMRWIGVAIIFFIALIIVVVKNKVWNKIAK